MTATVIKPSLRLRLAGRGVDMRLLLVVPAVLVVLVLFVYPFIFGIRLSLTPQRFNNPFDNYRAFFSDPYYSSSLLNTLVIAVPATFVNVFAAVPIASAPRPSSFRSAWARCSSRTAGSTCSARPAG